MYDLNLFPINQQQGKPQAMDTGFLAAIPPRRAVRSRSDDLLVVSFFTKDVSGRLSPQMVDSWLADLAENFFKTSGSVTSAMRSLIESLNLTILEKNLKSAGEGSAVTGAINLAAIHRESVFIVQCGFAHAFTLTQAGLGHFYDNSQSDRGLGLSRTPKIRFYQADLGDEGYLFFTDQPPVTWTEDLLNFGGFPKIAQLRRRLLNQASPTFRLDLVQIMPGEGQVRTAKTPLPEPEKTVRDEPVQPAAPATSPPTDSLEPVEEPVAMGVSETQQVLDAAPQLETAASQGEPETLPAQSKPVDDKPVLAGQRDREQGSVNGKPDKDDHLKTKSKASPRPRQSFAEQVAVVREGGLRGLESFFNWSRKTRHNLETFFNNILHRVGLTGEDGLNSLSNRTLILITLAVPLVVVAIAVGVYLGRGRTLQYQYYLEQAELAVVNARVAEDPGSAREGWSQAMLFLEQAESFRRSNEVVSLQAESQRALDALDGALRLSYHPAIIGSLPQEINITRIISFGLDLYMLDAVGGRVIHGSRTSHGYQVNADFVCASGNFSGGAIDPLVDMVSLPINNPYQAHILGADAIGNVIYCGPGQQPVVQTLPRGDGLVGAVTRIASDGNLLYVLDPSVDAVRIYHSTNGQFLDPPSNYFAGAGEGVKPTLAPIVDLAVSGSDLYLLRNDGMVVHCNSTGLAADPVNCENPVRFVDGRPNREDQPVVMPESTFVTLLYTAPPEPAVNILDGDNADIFRYSLRFRLNRRLRSDFGNYEITSPSATAFTIGVDRIAFMAFGHQVFFAYVE